MCGEESNQHTNRILIRVREWLERDPGLRGHAEKAGAGTSPSLTCSAVIQVVAMGPQNLLWGQETPRGKAHGEKSLGQVS